MQHRWRLPIQTLYTTEQRARFDTSLGVLVDGKKLTTKISYWVSKTTLKVEIQWETVVIHPKDSSLYYSLPLVRNVYVNGDGLLINVMIPVYRGEPVHATHKDIALPQPIKISTTAATVKLDRK